MSLINDALKKAQKQRTEDGAPLSAMPSIGGEPAARIAKRAKPVGYNSLILGVAAGGIVLLLLGVGVFFLYRFMAAPPEKPLPDRAAPVVQAAPASTPSATVAPGPAPSAYVLPVAAPSGTAAGSAPAAPTPLPAAAPAAGETTVVAVDNKPVGFAPIVPAAEPEAPRPAAPTLKLAPKAIAYIEGLRVAGIRVSATDSKVLMNDRVYRVGDTVEHNLGLKLAVIATGALTFEDERGARYTRNF